MNRKIDLNRFIDGFASFPYRYRIFCANTVDYVMRYDLNMAELDGLSQIIQTYADACWKNRTADIRYFHFTADELGEQQYVAVSIANNIVEVAGITYVSDDELYYWTFDGIRPSGELQTCDNLRENMLQYIQENEDNGFSIGSFTLAEILHGAVADYKLANSIIEHYFAK